MIRSLVRKFTAVGFLLASAAFISLWFLSPAFALLFFHSYAYLDYLRLMDVEFFSMIINNILFYMLLGLQSFRLNGMLNIFMYAMGYGLIIPLLLINSNPIRIIFAWIAGYYATTLLLYYVHRRVRRSPQGRVWRSPYPCALLFHSNIHLRPCRLRRNICGQVHRFISNKPLRTGHIQFRSCPNKRNFHSYTTVHIRPPLMAF